MRPLSCLAVLIVVLCQQVVGFMQLVQLPPQQQKISRYNCSGGRDGTTLNLVPVEGLRLKGVPSSLTKFSVVGGKDQEEEQEQEGGDDAKKRLKVGLIEQRDVKDLVQLLQDCFPAEVIASQTDFSQLELRLLNMPLKAVNKYINAYVSMEIEAGIKWRLGDRLINPNIDVSNESLILAVMWDDDDAEYDAGKGAAGSTDVSGVSGGGSARSIVACVEVGLRKPDGTLLSTFPFRNVFTNKPNRNVRPYLSNLAVSSSARGQGLGKQLVRLCEHVVKNNWGYDTMYLHVDLSNDVAYNLYTSMGYKGLPEYDVNLMMRKLFGFPDIRYSTKKLLGVRTFDDGNVPRSSESEVEVEVEVA